MRTSPIIQFQAQTISKKTEVEMEWSLHSSSKYILGAVILKTESGSEFKVNGQRLKHYLGIRKNED